MAKTVSKQTVNGVDYDIRDKAAHEAIEALQDKTPIYRGAVPSGSDIDDFVTPGVWYVNNSASLPDNWPSTTLGTLIVNNTTLETNPGTVQMVTDYYGDVFIRYKRSTGWTDFKKLLGEDKATIYKGTITSADDIDNFVSPGMWYASNSNSLPAHWASNTIGTLIVNNTSITDNPGTIQMVVDFRGDMYVRYKKAAGWLWFEKVSYIRDFYGVPTFNRIDGIPYRPTIVRGVTCSKTSPGTFHVEGSKTEGSALPRFVICGDLSVIPDGFEKGKEYEVYVKGENTFVWISAYFNDSATGAVTLFKSNQPLNGEQNAHFKIPADCTGIAVTIRFDEADTFNEDVSIYIAEKAPANKRKAITDAVVLNPDSIVWISNIIETYPFGKKTVNGVTGEKVADSKFKFTGTKNTGAWSTIDLYRSHTVMPEGMEAGKTYSVYLDSQDVSFWVVSYDGDEDASGTARYKSENNKHGDQYGTFTLPAEGVQGVSLGFKCDFGSTFNETVTLIIEEQKSQAERSFISSVNAATSITEKKIYSIGNSFLTGVVYTNGAQSGVCTFKDAIYGQIAMELGISQDNTNHIYHGNTGFISPSTSAPFIYDSHSDVICDTDLSEYDYCLSHFNGSDLRKSLGTIDADGTGSTLADAVVRVVNHIKTNKWICKLILLGTPPYSADYAGDDIFITPQGTSGNSIDDMDNLMYAMALKYHFIYVSWQDLEISYHYMDFADYQPGDTGARHANSVNTYRALGEFAAMQIPAVSSTIAIGKLMNSIGG